jgi:HEAT repeat protein
VSDSNVQEDDGVLPAVSAILGAQVRDLSELYSGSFGDYRKAIPTLIDWLSRDEDFQRTQAIARCLAVPWATGIAGPALLQRLRRNKNPADAVSWALANALEVVATPAELCDLIELATDERYGHARQMLTLALGKIRDPNAVLTLRQLLSDPLVDGHAVQALGKLVSLPEAQAARSALLPFLESRVAWKRRAAKTTISRLDRLRRPKTAG